jgi:hypothetical protein
MKPAELEFFRSPDDAIEVSFLSWWRRWIKSMNTGATMKVPCGTCVTCCSCDVELREVYGDTLADYDTVEKDGATLLRQTADGWCGYLKDGKCSIYARRPFVCRTYDCRTFLAARSIVVDPKTGDVVATCETALRKFRIVARTDEDLRAMRAVALGMMLLQERIDGTDFKATGALPLLALMTWKEIAPMVDRITGCGI